MKLAPILVLCGLLIILGSCSGGDNNEGVMNPPDSNGTPNNDNPAPTASVGYQDDIRPIIQGNCTQCHADPPLQDAPMSLTTYDDVRNAVVNRGLLTRINSTSNPMPPTGLLPMASRQLIQDWVDLGYAK